MPGIVLGTSSLCPVLTTTLEIGLLSLRISKKKLRCREVRKIPLPKFTKQVSGGGGTQTVVWPVPKPVVCSVSLTLWGKGVARLVTYRREPRLYPAFPNLDGVGERWRPYEVSAEGRDSVLLNEGIRITKISVDWKEKLNLAQ